jgi:hypothetical protein
MKTAASKVNANKSSKRSHALKELLEKQETNLLEIKEDLPLESPDRAVNVRTVQFGSDRPALPVETSLNLSESIGIFHELISKESSIDVMFKQQTIMLFTIIIFNEHNAII